MFDFDGICGVPEHLVILLVALDDWFWWYLWWPDTLLDLNVFLGCLILMVFVVAGQLFDLIVCLQKSTLNGICRGRTCFCFFMFLSRSELWTVFVVFQSIWLFYCFLQKWTLIAICRGGTASVLQGFPSEVDFEWYLSWPEVLLKDTIGGIIINFCYFTMILRLRLIFLMILLIFFLWF